MTNQENFGIYINLNASELFFDMNNADVLFFNSKTSTQSIVLDWILMSEGI